MKKKAYRYLPVTSEIDCDRALEGYEHQKFLFWRERIDARGDEVAFAPVDGGTK